VLASFLLRINGKLATMMKFFKLLGVTVCILALLFVVVAFVTQEPELAAKNAELNSVKNDIAKVQQENAQLAQEKKRVGSKEYIEEKARKNLGLVKNNEIIFFDVDK